MLIATAGKGGVGKTTLIAALARYLQGQAREFAVIDADPVGTLGLALGAEIRPTIAQTIERDTRIDTLSDIQIDGLLASLPGGGALLRMGHHQREGCFCRVNTLTKLALTKIGQRYPIVLMDNEAGIEHVTRGIGGGLSRLVLVSDESIGALRVTGQILEAVRRLNAGNADQERLRGTAHLVVRTRAMEGSDLHAQIQQAAQDLGLPEPRLIPHCTPVEQRLKAGEAMPPFTDGWSLYLAVQSWAKADIFKNGAVTDGGGGNVARR